MLTLQKPLKYVFNFFWLFFIIPTVAQELVTTENFKLTARVKPSPENIFEKFRKAGMEPVNHILTDAEIQTIEKAFTLLPPLHQKLLKQHLYSISFMDNMPNTALTSPVESGGTDKKLFNITFRAEILHETISQWATSKENTCYEVSGNSGYKVLVEAGNFDAIVYVLLHEATHVVDTILNITPHPDEVDALVKPTAFTRDIWQRMNVPVSDYIKPLLATTRFRGGKPLAVTMAPEVYQTLKQTPFVSLYSMASWFEDLAEFTTIYHLTHKLNQPFRLAIMQDGLEVFHFEPMENKLIKDRIEQLNFFYD